MSCTVVRLRITSPTQPIPAKHHLLIILGKEIMSKKRPYQRVPLEGDSEEEEEEEEVTLYDKRFGEGVYEENVELIFRQRKGGKLSSNGALDHQPLNKRTIACVAVVLIALILFIMIGYTAWRIQSNNANVPFNTTIATPVGPTVSTGGDDDLTHTQGPVPNDPKSWRIVMEGGMSELSLLLHDINKDGTLDIIINNITSSLQSPGFGGCPGKPDKCLDTKGFSPCQVRLLGFDGKTSALLWSEWVMFDSFAGNCRADLNSDQQLDCIFAGRMGNLAAFDIHNSKLLWIVDSSLTVPSYNYYYPLITEDFDGDGVPDIIVSHGGDPLYSDYEKKRSPGFLAVVSGANGRKLSTKILTPDNHETYSSPVLYKLSDELELVLFGSGGETIPGSLWAISLSSLKAHVESLNNGSSYEINKSYKGPVCYTQEELAKLRPKIHHHAYSESKREDWLNNCPTLPGGIKPIWNIYRICVYELIPAGVSGTILPPVIVDVNNDNKLDILVSQFNDHTLLYDGSSGLIAWDHFTPNTQSYSVPAPLYYNDDNTLDFVARFNRGKWQTYDYSYMTVLDGRNGDILWRINCSQAAMSSPVTLQSKVRGEDGFMFIGIGCGGNVDDLISGKNNGQADGLGDNGRSKRERVPICPRKRFEEEYGNNICTSDELPIHLEKRDNELIDSSGDETANIPSMENIIDIDVSKYLPEDLWESNGPSDIFPDPEDDPQYFMKEYCGYDPDLLKANLYFLTRKLIEDSGDPIPVFSFDPYIYRFSGNDDRRKRHGGSHLPTTDDDGDQSEEDLELKIIKKLMKDRKKLRCAHVLAPILSAGTPVITDSDGDGKFEAVISLTYTPISGPYSVKALDFIHPPKLIIQSFTIENRLKAVYGSKADGLDMSSYWSIEEQSWNEYMGRNGNGLFVDPSNKHNS